MEEEVNAASEIPDRAPLQALDRMKDFRVSGPKIT
jgi:hypothetical protein